MATTIVYDRVRENGSGSGTSTVTLSGAVSGYRTFSSTVGTGNITWYCIENAAATNEWEIGYGTLTNSTTLTRTTILFSSNSNNAVNFTAGSKNIFLPLVADQCAKIDPAICEGRLTLTSATPVTTSDVTAATDVFYTPYIGERISLKTAAGYWKLYEFTEMTLSLSALTTTVPYDFFCNDTGAGVLALTKLAWTSATARATALLRTEGVWCKSTDTSFRYLGTIYPTAATTTEDSAKKRFVWNCNNRVRKPVLQAAEATTSWTYTTNTYRQANANTANKIELVAGLAEEIVDLRIMIEVGNSGGTAVYLGIGEDSTTAIATGQMGGKFSAYTTTGVGVVYLAKAPAIGYHYYSWLEKSAASGTTTWYNNGDASCGVNGTWTC